MYEKFKKYVSNNKILKKSKKYVIDLDSELAIKFGNLWLPNNTTIGARQYPNGKIERTHFYFESDESLETNIKSLPAELYCDHNIVAFGTTIHKQTKEPMKRFWESEESVLPFNDSILAIFNKINFASMICIESIFSSPTRNFVNNEKSLDRKIF